MSKLVFAAVIFVLGYPLYMAVRRQRQLLPAALADIVPRLILALTIGIPALILVFSIFRVIPAGHVGVKVLFGQVDPVPLREGLNVVWNPLYDIVVMDTRVHKHTSRYDAASKDLQAVHVDMVLNYRLIPERAPEVYTSIGLASATVIVDPAAQEVLKAQTATHNAAEILVRRQAIKSDVQAEITQWLAKYGVELKEASLANKGDAEATYNARVADSLTPVLIQQQYLARWDGRLPQYTLGGGAVPFVQLPVPGEGRR